MEEVRDRLTIGIAIKSRELRCRRENHREGPCSGSHTIDTVTGCFLLAYSRKSEREGQDLLGTTVWLTESRSGL